MCKTKGFTLIELLVVIAIIALLLALITPGLKKAKDYTKLVVCSTNLHQIGLAFYAYGHDYNDRTTPGNQPNGPTVWGADLVWGPGQLLYNNYLPTPQSRRDAVVFCPADKIDFYPIFKANWLVSGRTADIGYEFRDSMDGNWTSSWIPGVPRESYKGVPLSRIAHHALMSDWFGSHTYYQHKLKYNVLLGDGSIYVINDIPYRGSGGNPDDPSEVGFTAWIDHLMTLNIPQVLGFYGLDYLYFDAVDYLAGSPKWKIPIMAKEGNPSLPCRYWQ